MKMILRMMQFLIIFCMPIVVFAVTVDSSTQVKKNRNYPGGRDESDLVVQENPAPPSANTDRVAVEQKVLKSYFKKEEDPASNKKNNQ